MSNKTCERDENTCRIPLAPLEAAELAKTLEDLYRPQNAERQRAAAVHGSKGGRGKKKTLVETSTKVLKKPKRDNSKRTKEQAAKAVGYSPKTLRQVDDAQEEQTKQAVYDLWMECRSQKTIADELKLSPAAVCGYVDVFAEKFTNGTDADSEFFRNFTESEDGEKTGQRILQISLALANLVKAPPAADSR